LPNLNKEELRNVVQNVIEDSKNLVAAREYLSNFVWGKQYTINENELEGVIFQERKARDNVGARSAGKAVYAILRDVPHFKVIEDFDRQDTAKEKNCSALETIEYMISSEDEKMASLRQSIAKAKYFVVNAEGTIIFSHEPKNPFQCLARYVAAKLINPKIITLHINSVCSPNMNGIVEESELQEARKFIPFINKMIFRDRLSADFAKKHLGVDGRYIPEALFYFSVMYPDLAIPQYGDLIQPFGASSFDYGKYDFSKPYIIVAGSSMLKSIDENAKRYTRLVNALKEFDLKIFLFKSCAKNGYECKIFSQVSKNTGCIVIPQDVNIVQICAILGNARAMVGGRFHPAVLASIGGTPCIMTSANCHKSAGFLDYFADIYKSKVYDVNLEKDEDIKDIVKEVSVVLGDDGLRDKVKNRAIELGEQATDMRNIVNTEGLR
jgi:hypothetical protein